MSNLTNARLSIAKEIWYEVVGFIDHDDRQDAADGFLSLLIDNDITATEIREAFKNDEWIADSVTTYLGDDHPQPEEYDDWEEEEEDEDEINEDY